MFKKLKLSTNEVVALKKFNIKIDDFEHFINLSLIEREVKILKKMNHPNIIRYIDSFSDENDIPCIITDFA